jgi:hypothetical protein
VTRKTLAPRLRWTGSHSPYSSVGTVTVIVRVGLSDRRIVVDGTYQVVMSVVPEIARSGFWAENENGDPVFTPPREIVSITVPRPRLARAPAGGRRHG